MKLNFHCYTFEYDSRKKKNKELSWVALSQGHSTSASFSFIPANILELLRVLIIADINMKRKKKNRLQGVPRPDAWQMQESEGEKVHELKSLVCRSVWISRPHVQRGGGLYPRVASDVTSTRYLIILLLPDPWNEKMRGGSIYSCSSFGFCLEIQEVWCRFL